MSFLEKFKKHTVVVADTGDFECNSFLYKKISLLFYSAKKNVNCILLFGLTLIFLIKSNQKIHANRCNH